MQRLSIYLVFTCLLALSAVAQEHKISVQNFEPLVYPPIARQARVVGDVKVLLKVAATGEITEVKMISGHPMLKASVQDNVKKWRFHCDDCSYRESFSHEITYAFVIDGVEHGVLSVEYHFPNTVVVVVNHESLVPIGVFAPQLPKYFWLWKIFHPRYWRFHGFD